MAQIRVLDDRASVALADASAEASPAVTGRDHPSAPPVDPSRDLAGALHDVSNALTVVLGWIERARESIESPDDLCRALDVAASRAAEARGIVRGAIGAEPHAEPEEAVHAISMDALTGLDPELRRRSIDARAHVASAVATRRIPHASSVRQILTNLLLNASAMSPPGSTVHLDASAAGDRVVFSVIDAGPGIPSERRALLFHAGITTRPGGAGIGLRYAAALARSLGGELRLANSDEGARFELSWPLVADDHMHDSVLPVGPPAPRSARQRGLPLEGLRVLLVEDDAAVVDLLDTALTARGADVVSVRHRDELDSALSSGHFDAALFDISPIQHDVRGAVARARDANSDLRVVMISGSAAAPPALPEGWISAWVRKPFEVAEIVHTIAPAPRSA